MSENLAFEKNLGCIEKYNPKLKEELLGLPYLTQDIQLIDTNLKEPNLSYNGLFLHSQQGAELEAKNIFNNTKNTPSSMHIIFGIGLGYLFKEFCERSKGVVFLYEPNLEILRVTLELVDFSKELSQQNVRVFSDIFSLKQAFLNSYKYKANSAFMFLNSYKELYPEGIEETFKEVEISMGACLTQYNTVKAGIANSVSMTLENLNYTFDEIPLAEIKDVYKNKTALIVSAGPSLDSCIESIKKNRDNVVIFCVGTAFKALMKNNIKPDFINMMELNDCSGQVKGFDLSDINLIIEPYTNTSMHTVKAKQTFVFPTNSVHANVFWADFTGIDLSSYESKGTVSYEALSSAKMLGFSKIVLVGQDLAYANNKCYSDDAAYSQLAFEKNPETNQIEFKIKDRDKYIESLKPVTQKLADSIYTWFVDYKIKNLNDTLYYVKGIKGDTLPTQAGYATFIEYFKEFAHFNPDLELINTSMIGAQIDGFKNIPIEKALENAPVIEKVDLTRTFEYDKKRVLESLDKEQNNLGDILQEFVKSKEYIFKYERELDRRKTVTAEANNYFKKLFSLYNKISKEYYYNDLLYNAIAFSETIDLQYILNETEKVDIESIKEIYSLLKNYFEFVESKTLDALEKITQQKEKIVESLNPKG